MVNIGQEKGDERIDMNRVSATAVLMYKVTSSSQ